MKPRAKGHTSSNTATNTCSVATTPPRSAGVPPALAKILGKPEIRLFNPSHSERQQKKLLSTTILRTTIFLPMCLVLALLVVPQNFAFAQQPLSWEQLDKQLKPRIYHLNVGVKMRLKNGKFVMHSDNTRKSRYPVFSAFDEDFGYRVAGWGSSFPVKTSKKTGNYFITSGHVLATGPATIVECERFFAAMRLYAEQTASHKDVESRYSQLQKIVNMPTVNKNMSLHELATYHYTSEAIWDCYHTYLSIRADKGRIMFKKYLSQAGVAHEVGYFLHAPGPAEKKPLVAQIYKTHEVSGPLDIAILSVKSDPILPIEL
ncbi:MAG: hypothetical protein K8F91_03125, partial [Candidatus Obscuribacterales bacterium]|nr:hypothetical protein [Candidatus Obscuribacterales bacterium]